MLGTARQNVYNYYPDRLYNLKRLISSMTDNFIFTPALRTVFFNRESYENRESLYDVIRTALSWIKTHWSRVTEVAHCEENYFLR